MSTFDLDALIAEAHKAPFVFKVGGREFTLPHPEDLDKKVMDFGDDGLTPQTIMRMLELALGDQWKAFDELPMPLGALGKLFNAWQSHAGVSAGESPASPSS